MTDIKSTLTSITGIGADIPRLRLRRRTSWFWK